MLINFLSRPTCSIVSALISLPSLDAGPVSRHSLIAVNLGKEKKRRRNGFRTCLRRRQGSPCPSAPPWECWRGIRSHLPALLESPAILEQGPSASAEIICVQNLQIEGTGGQQGPSRSAFKGAFPLFPKPAGFAEPRSIEAG